MSAKRAQARRLMQHYFKLVAERAGVKWDHDNVAEIGDLVDLLIDAAKEEMMDDLPCYPSAEAA